MAFRKFGEGKIIATSEEDEDGVTEQEPGELPQGDGPGDHRPVVEDETAD